MSAATVWLGCGVLRAEMEALHHQGRITGRLVFLESMLHMVPQKLEATLAAALEQPRSDGARCVLVYGDCCPGMLDLPRQFRAGRVNAINCAQLLVGPARYRELMQEQAFVLLPEWTSRWQEVIRVELGLSKQVAHDLMREHRRVLVYLDTGLALVPRRTLDDCSAYTGLPWRVETVSLDHLLESLLKAEAMAEARTAQEACR
ncbi:MAG: DUF1638 domain-containing protein [Verrucomicrobia bacterium]|nr:DUF1638 domain-containing protein [Verrucomicrobiota bacterium]